MEGKPWTARDCAEIMLGNWVGHGKAPGGLVDDVLLFAKLYGPRLAAESNAGAEESFTDWAAEARKSTQEG